ncbi:MAG: nitrile hydratase subunit alpha [Acetobacteraceae bacterium]
MSHAHDHDHDHDHDDHAPIAHEETSRFLALERAVRELLIEKGVLTAEQISRQIEAMEARTPALGARVVAKAWSDPAFRDWLLRDARAACASLGIDMANMPELVVLPNEPGLHHLVVCTLCSCYPRMVLGPPPAWYKSTEYRARAVLDPRGVLAEFGVSLPAGTRVRIVDSTADLRYLVLPERPPGTDGWDEERLAALVTRDSMIGTGLVASP